MAIFIGFESALRFLLANGLHRERSVYGQRWQKLEPTKEMPQPGVRPDWKLAKEKGFPEGVGEGPLDVCVADQRARTWSGLFDCRMWECPKQSSFLKVDDTYCVAKPETVFLQMALVLPFPHLVELGYLLCGTYVPDSINAASHTRAKPLTTVKKLGSYLDQCGGIRGVAPARRALACVIDGSASVMETRLVMLLCLSPNKGGFGIPKPKLNCAIKLPEKMATRTATSVRKPDLYWRKEKVALEYDSKQFHSGESKTLNDQRRSNELESLGIKMLHARSADLYDPLAFERLAIQVSKSVMHRVRIREDDYIGKREALRTALLGDGQWDILRLPE